jgi:excinuclease ABC subunit C
MGRPTDTTADNAGDRPPAGAPAPPVPPVKRPRGRDMILAELKRLPASPGVYRMLNGRGDVLYVGKARNIRKRVQSYTQTARLPNRLRRMVAATVSLEVVTTHTEAEALLLEANLIKRHAPHYNVLLRDDKSFPYILITGDHDFPQLMKYRGPRSRPGQYFGPFASAGAVNETLTALQRAFLLRSCNDTVFANRDRPCLLYQIKRCSAPCVGRIGGADYAELVRQTARFLKGGSGDVQREFAQRMEESSRARAYESAAVYRDRIRALSQIQARQDINMPDLRDADVFAVHQAGGHSCVEVFFFRDGRNYGNHAYFPRHDREVEAPEIIAAFVGQFYAARPPPPVVLVSHAPEDAALLAEALSVRAGRPVELAAPRRGDKRKLVEHAAANAAEALARRLGETAQQHRLLEGLGDLFGLEQSPKRIEVYDNSHVSGTHPVGGMIVSGPEGFEKNAYRKFNIRPAEPPAAGTAAAPIADDYAMLRQVLTRRFQRALKEDPTRESEGWPDLILIDGGAGHLSAAREVLGELGLAELALAAIAKGPDRDAGEERFFLPGREPFSLPARDPVLYFLQRLRDEAHRYAIGAHRTRRSKAIGASPLDEVPGIGRVRKRALLNHFGSARAVARAGLSDLEKVAGISTAVAKIVYEHFHGDG